VSDVTGHSNFSAQVASGDEFEYAPEVRHSTRNTCGLVCCLRENELEANASTSMIGRRAHKRMRKNTARYGFRTHRRTWCYQRRWKDYVRNEQFKEEESIVTQTQKKFLVLREGHT
jgi:hypothetical protein